MNPTDCPYVDCQQDDIEVTAEECPSCKKWLKRCGKCRTPNRSFANYCRFCGELLPGANESWSGCKGDIQRRALNRFVIPHSPPDLEVTEIQSTEFPGRCGSILADDGYLIAVSENGIIKVIDLNRLKKEPYTFMTDGNIYAEPALHHGTLYIGTVKNQDQEKGIIFAYTLGRISLNPPEVVPRWSMDLKGTPVQALLPFADRLYLNMGFKDGHREVHIIDDIKGTKPTMPKCVYKGELSSTLAADPFTNKVFFLSETSGRLYINMFDHSLGTAPEMMSMQVKDAPNGLQDYIPIAVLGAKLFAVFGENKELCRLDVHNKNFETTITNRVRKFAVPSISKQIIINSRGVFSTPGGMQENLMGGESVISGPVVLRDRAVVVGLRDGKIRFYNLNKLSIHNETQVFHTDERVQTMAAYKNMIAVGNQKGKVKLLQLT